MSESVAEPTSWGPGQSRDFTDWVSPDRPRTREDDLREALIAVQNAVTGTVAPDDVMVAVAAQLQQIAAQLAPFTLDAVPTTGWDDVLRAARTATFSPAFGPGVLDDEHYRGEVTLGTFYLGANQGAHGGAVALLMDKVLGTLSSHGRPASRTAYLNVNFRAVTPINRPLRFHGWFERIEGRKRFVAATLHDGDVLVADATGLFVELRLGQR